MAKGYAEFNVEYSLNAYRPGDPQYAKLAGAYWQLADVLLAGGELDLIIFLRDPLTAQPHEPDVSALLRLCDVQKLPLATNVCSAVIMLEALKSGSFTNLVKNATK